MSEIWHCLSRKEYLHSQLAQVQFPHDEMEDTLSGDEATVVADRNSGSYAELAEGKQPAAVSFATTS